MTRDLGRRPVLTGLAGLTALAGCNARLPGSGPEPIDGGPLRTMATGDRPTVTESVPVDVERSAVAARIERVRDRLAALPGPFDAEQIPNGAIRQRLNDRYEAARASLDRARDGPTPYVRLDRAGEAEVDTAAVWATWLAIEDDLTVEAVEAEAPAVEDRIDAFGAAWAYRGEDPVRGVRVQGELETRVQAARVWAEADRPRERGPFAVGEAAEELERARVNVETASYLFQRYSHSLDSSETTDLSDTFTRTRRRLDDRLAAEAEALPNPGPDADAQELVDGEVRPSAALWALSELHEEFGRGRREYRDGDGRPAGPARAVLERTGTLVFGAAFSRLRGRIEAGDVIRITSAEDVLALRESAVEAVRDADGTGTGGGLVRELRPRFARRIRWADAEFGRSDGTVTRASARRDGADYVLVRETCRALPIVADAVESVLRDAEGASARS